MLFWNKSRGTCGGSTRSSGMGEKMSSKVDKSGFHYMIGRYILAPCVVIAKVNNSKDDFLGFLLSLGIIYILPVFWSSRNISSYSGIHVPSMFLT